ncbi:MAG: phosphoribosylanthranilate isomerase [Actinobacteria bacterium]|nr:phosphoribosylanthranilate isomerase [Actinomycetota bacterium]
MTWLKVCGLTNHADTDAAAEAGVDALGFVLVPTSPRAISLDLAAELIARVEQKTFLLTHDLDPDALVAAALRTGATGVQPYGRFAAESAEAATGVGLMVLRPLALHDEWQRVPPAQFPLFDSKNPNGIANGARLDPDQLPDTEREYVVAGGLTPQNVGPLIARRHPFGVDVSSGVEVGPGQKDPELIAAFAKAVRESN